MLLFWVVFIPFSIGAFVIVIRHIREEDARILRRRLELDEGDYDEVIDYEKSRTSEEWKLILGPDPSELEQVEEMIRERGLQGTSVDAMLYRHTLHVLIPEARLKTERERYYDNST